MEHFFPEIFHTLEQQELILSQPLTKLSFILPEIVNQIWFLLIIFLFYYFNLVKTRLFIFLLITAFLPFLINGVLFPISYMPDQFRYFWGAYSLRNLGTVDPSIYLDVISVAGANKEISLVDKFFQIKPNALYISSLFYSYFPIPFINSVASISIINRIIYTVFIIFSVHYKIIRGKMILFFLLFPGLVLYSSIALREMIIVTLMLGIAHCLIYKKYFFIIPLFVFLFLIKFQNAVILGTISFLYIIFFSNYYGSKLLKIFFLFFVFLLLIKLYSFFQINIQDILNYFEGLRRYFFAEECAKIKGTWCNNFELSNSGYESMDFSKFYLILSEAIHFSFAPLIWESSNFFQLLQSLENIFVNLLFILLLYQLFQYNKIKTIFWIVSIFFAFSIYGILIVNFGTLSRYRFPFFIFFIFIISSEINKFRFNKTLG